MKKFIKYLAVILTFTTKLYAITMKSASDVNLHTQPPPEYYNFKPWTKCGLTTVYGVYSNGFVRMEAPTSVWPIGPYIAVSSAHITTFIEQPNTRWEKFLVNTNQYRYIKNMYVMGDDTILYQIDTSGEPFPYWNRMWRGPYIQMYTNSRVVNGGTTVSFSPEPVSRIFDNPFMVLGAGAIFNKGVGYPPNICWETVTNTIVGPTNYRLSIDDSVRIINRESYRIDNWVREYNRLGAGINNLLYGSYIYVTYDKHPELPNYWPNFGVWVGDSGSGLFIYQDGEWQLVGLLNNGGNVPGSQTSASVLDQVLGWTSTFWNTVGKPENYQILSKIKDTAIPTYGSHKDCNTTHVVNPGPVVNNPPPIVNPPVVTQPAPIVPPAPTVNPTSVIVTNYVTVTNYQTITTTVVQTNTVTLTNIVQYWTSQQRLAIDNAIKALKFASDVFTK